jgi:hypothetical protein
MTRSIQPVPYRQNDPSPQFGDRRTHRRIIIFVLVVVLGGVLVGTGRDLQTVVLTLLGVGLAAATIARWVIDDVPLPSVTSFEQGQAR